MLRVVLLALFVAIWGCNGQPPAAVLLGDPVEQGLVESAVDTTESPTQRHDFGVAKPSVTLKHDFTIENRTGTAWTLAGVKTDCSCTIATPEWKVIPAGQKKSVTVELQTGSAIRFLPVTHTVEVMFREPSVPRARLSVSALIRDVLYITPERVVLADLGKGDTVVRPVVIDNHGVKRITAPPLKSNVPWIIAGKPVEEAVREALPSSPLQRFRYDININGKSLNEGHHEAQLKFESSLNLTSSTVSVSVDIRPSIALIPSRAFLGRITPGGSGTMTILIRSPLNSELDKSAIRIESALGNQLSWMIEQQSKNTAQLKLTLKPTATEGLVHGEFVINYRDSRIPVPVDALVTTE